MTTKISELISFLFHPLFMPLYAIFIIFQTESRIGYIQEDVKNYIYGIILIALVLIPLIIVLAFHSLKIINSIYMEDKRERVYPLIVIGLSALITFYFLDNSSIIPNIIAYFVFAVGVNAIITAIISSFWKISTHTIGIGGLLAYIIITSLIYWINIEVIFSLVIIASGLIAFARLSLQKHSAAQIYIGFFLGGSVTASSLLLLMYS